MPVQRGHGHGAVSVPGSRSACLVLAALCLLWAVPAAAQNPPRHGADVAPPPSGGRPVPSVELERLRQRALGGDVNAMLPLARLLLSGPPLLRDIAEGYRWMMRAAYVEEWGCDDVRICSGDARQAATRMFIEGVVLEGRYEIHPDPVQAYMWAAIVLKPWRRRERLLYPLNDIKRDLERTMSRAQVEEAERLVQAWRPMSPQEALQNPFPLPVRR